MKSHLRFWWKGFCSQVHMLKACQSSPSPFLLSKQSCWKFEDSQQSVDQQSHEDEVEVK